MNTQTLTTMIEQNLALADTGLAALKQTVDGGELIAADQHTYLTKKRNAVQARVDAAKAEADAKVAAPVAVEKRADAPAVQPPTSAPAPAVKTPAKPVVKQSSVLRRTITPKAKANGRATKPALAKLAKK